MNSSQQKQEIPTKHDRHNNNIILRETVSRLIALLL